MSTSTVSARIDPEIVPLLKERAKRADLKVSTYLARLIYENLGETENDLLRKEVENLRRELADMRDDLTKITRALLTVYGQDSEEEADKWKAEVEEWIKTNLR